MKFRVIGLGELLWDMLPGGRQLGGAPTNFTYHAGALGAETRLVSRVGADDLGREALERLVKLGVPTDCVEVDLARPTGSVGVVLAADGQPQYEIHENVAWDAIHGEPASKVAVAGADAVCFGSLAQRSEPSRSTIQALVAATPTTALRVFDINLRQRYYTLDVIEQSLELANVLKVNDEELPRLAALLGLKGDERMCIRELVERHRVRVVACTRGGRGSLLFADGRWSDHPGIPARVVDTVGAGDSFTAALSLGLLQGWDLDRINETANRLAAFVCSCAGGTPSLPEHLRQAFSTSAA